MLNANSDHIPTIVSIDDDPAFHMLVKLILERHGLKFNFESAMMGEEGLALLSRVKADLVILDILMPDINGVEVLERLKADPLLRDLPVIMVSPVRNPETIDRCFALGAVDYITEPQAIMDIALAVQKVLAPPGQ